MERRIGIQIPVAVAEVQHPLHGMPQAVRVCLLGSHGGGVRGIVHRQVQLVGCGGRKSLVGAVIPLHGGAGTGAEIAALLGGQRQIAHADLIAIIHKRCAGQGKQHGVSNFQLIRGQTGGGADGIMVAGNQAVQAVLAGRLVAGQPVIQELVNTRAGIRTEIRLADVMRVRIYCAIIIAHQPAVAIALPFQHKVHIKAVFQGLARLVPFAHQSGFGVFLVQHSGNIAPDGTGILFVVGIILDQAGCHIHTETIAAHIQPKAHHILHGFHRCARAGGVGGHLPLFAALAVTIVQSRLALEEVQNISTVAVGLAANERHTVTGAKAGVRPDIAVGILILFRLAALLKPCVFLAGMAGHQVQQHMDALGMSCFKQRFGIRVGAIAGGNQLIIAHIIPGVLERGIKAGVDPKGVAPQLFDVIQLFDNPLQIADAIPVGIIKALGVNFVKNCVFQPLFQNNHSYYFLSLCAESGAPYGSRCTGQNSTFIIRFRTAVVNHLSQKQTQIFLIFWCRCTILSAYGAFCCVTLLFSIRANSRAAALGTRPPSCTSTT